MEHPIIQNALNIFAIITVLVGTFFAISGVLGYLRFPDVYTRMHATSKVGTFGVVLMLAAAAMATSLGWSKAVVLILFLLLTGPSTAHALSSAAYRLGIPMNSPLRDDLKKQVK